MQARASWQLYNILNYEQDQLVQSNNVTTRSIKLTGFAVKLDSVFVTSVWEDVSTGFTSEK